LELLNAGGILLFTAGGLFVVERGGLRGEVEDGLSSFTRGIGVVVVGVGAPVVPLVAVGVAGANDRDPPSIGGGVVGRGVGDDFPSNCFKWGTEIGLFTGVVPVGWSSFTSNRLAASALISVRVVKISRFSSSIVLLASIICFDH